MRDKDSVRPLFLAVETCAGAAIHATVRDMLALSLEFDIEVRGTHNAKPLRINATDYINSRVQAWREMPHSTKED